jgi:colanic acid biosynthesis glycosyl transferase WcaI
LKKVTIIGINYYPEDSAIGLYTTQKAEYLVSKGYNVSVITGFPYYPQWKIREEYLDSPYLLKETINGVDIYRNKQYVPKDPTFFKRILHLVSFTFGNFLNIFRVPKPDIVISIIPFTTSVFLGWLLKLRYNSKLWVHIQDFEFDAAIDSGLLGKDKKLIIKFFLWVERVVLKKADIISTISHGMIAKLKNKVKNKTYYFTNWIDTDSFNSLENNSHNYLDSKKFKILYSGNIGAKQDWNFFFSFLDKIKEIDDVEVIIVGEGAEKGKVVNRLKNYSFVTHYDLVPYKDLHLLLSSADLHILFQKSDVIDTVMPSKILGMMASKKPSLITGNLDSEVAKVIKISKGGYYLDGKNLQEIVELIIEFKKNKKLSTDLGNNAYDYINKHFSKDKVLDLFNSKLIELINEKR